MKKRALFTLALAMLMALMLCITVGATTTVTDDETDEVTLGNCTITGLDGVTIPEPTTGLVYTLDDETKTATVSGRGSFTGGNLVFPSSVTYGERTYAVTKINSNLFRSLSYSLYVPDSITFIGGGSNTGTFGNSTLDKVYIGSGLSGFEREVFSGSKGMSTFVCKSKPTYIGIYAFNQMSAGASGISDYELDLSQVIRFEEYAFNGASFLRELALNENVEHIGNCAFKNCSNMNGSIVIPANCQLKDACFNGTNLDLVVIKVNKGEKFTAPLELFSGAAAGLTVVISGDAVAGADYFFSNNAMTVHMPSFAQLQAFVSSVAKFTNGAPRITVATFYACEEGKYYSCTAQGVLTEKGDANSHYYTAETVHFEKNCSQYERESYICYCCGIENVVSQGTELGAHVNEITTKEANCQSMGYIVYECTVCDYEETVHFIDKTSHSATVKEYRLKDFKTVEEKTRCEHCNTLVSAQDVSLVNKCFIQGYGQELFDATMEYVSVSANGVATPSNATFNNAVIYFPSCVEKDGEIIPVSTVQGFKAKSIKAIYIPDNVTRIAGGSGVGCFGDISSLKNIVVGKGVTELEQEIFCMGSGATLDEFIFKGTISVLKHQCLTNVKAASTDIPYEFNTYLSYAGKWVNLNGNIIREARIARGCDLNEKYAFNNANGLIAVYIEGGEDASNALDLGQEFASNTATTNYYIKGFVTVSGQAAISDRRNIRIYMSSVEAIDLFASAIKSYDYSGRINEVTFMDCSTNTAWFVSSSANRVEHPSISFSHGGGLFESTSATCNSKGTSVEKCFVCGAIVASTTIEKLEHTFDGGVITKMPTATEEGIIVYTCFDCGEAKEERIIVALGTHKEIVKVYYENGFDKVGLAIITCEDCDHNYQMHLDAVFEILGYSVNNEYTAITCGYKINADALAYYEQNVAKLEFGIILANASDVATNGLLDESYNMLSTVRGGKIAIEERSIIVVDAVVKGATTDTLRNFDFILAMYILADKDADGELEMQYLQHSMNCGDNKEITVNGEAFNTISINRAIASA